MSTYTTVQGDTWDKIAYLQLGSVGYTDKIMNLNQQYLGLLTFPAGIELILPEKDVASSIKLPPWKRANK